MRLKVLAKSILDGIMVTTPVFWSNSNEDRRAYDIITLRRHYHVTFLNCNTHSGLAVALLLRPL